MRKNRTDGQPISETEGVVTRILTNGLFKVKLENKGLGFRVSTGH